MCVCASSVCVIFHPLIIRAVFCWVFPGIFPQLGFFVLGFTLGDFGANPPKSLLCPQLTVVYSILFLLVFSKELVW